MPGTTKKQQLTSVRQQPTLNPAESPALGQRRLSPCVRDAVRIAAGSLFGSGTSHRRLSRIEANALDQRGQAVGALPGEMVFEAKLGKNRVGVAR